MAASTQKEQSSLESHSLCSEKERHKGAQIPTGCQVPASAHPLTLQLLYSEHIFISEQV